MKIPLSGVFLTLIAGLCSNQTAQGQEPNVIVASEVERFAIPKEESIVGVALAPGKPLAAAVSMGGTLWLCKIEDKANPVAIKPQPITTDTRRVALLRVAFSPDSTRLLLGCADNSVRLLEAETGKELFTLEGHGGPVWSLAFFKDGKRALSGSTSDYSIIEWDLLTGKQLRKFTGMEVPSSLAISPDQTTFATPNFKSIQVWDINSGRQIRSLEGHSSRVEGLSYSPDGRQLISASRGSIRVWDVNKGSCIRQFGDGDILVESLSVSSDGQLVMLGAPGHIQVWNLEAERLEVQIKNLSGQATAVFAHDNRRFLVGEMWGGLRMWELKRVQRK